MIGALRHQEMRQHNVRFILSLIQQYGPVSRPELARRSGLTKASITRIIQDLRRAGIVDETTEYVRETGGRPASLLRMKGGELASVGIDLRIDRSTVFLRDLSGEQLARYVERANTCENPEDVLRRLCTVITKMLEDHPRVLTGIGVSVGGHPTEDRTGIVYSNYLNWGRVDVQTLCRKYLERPTLRCSVYAVAPCAAEANGASEAIGGVRELLHVQCGIGLGAAVPTLFAHKQPYLLKSDAVGHLPFSQSAQPCSVCQWDGCVDTVLGFASVVDRSAGLGIQVTDSPDFIERYCTELAVLWNSGCSEAQKIVEELGRDIARFIVTLAMLHRCPIVTIGGWPLFLGSDFISMIDKLVRSNSYTSHVRVEVSEYGDDASVIGAALFGAIANITELLRD